MFVAGIRTCVSSLLLSALAAGMASAAQPAPGKTIGPRLVEPLRSASAPIGARMPLTIESRVPRIPQSLLDLVPERASVAALGRSRALEAFRADLAEPPTVTPPTSATATPPEAALAAPRAGRTETHVHTTDLDADGVIDFRGELTLQFDQHDRIVHATSAQDYGADGTLELVEVTTAAYDARGNASRITRETDGDADGTFDARMVETFAYDAHARPVLYVVENDLGADGTIESRERFTAAYDGHGRLLRAVQERDEGADGSIEHREVTTITYDRNGTALSFELVVEGAPAAGIRIAYANAYDRRGNLARQQSDLDLAADATIDTRATVIRTYDAHRNVLTSIEEVDTGADGTLDSRILVATRYDARDRMAGQVIDLDEDGDGTIDTRLTLAVTRDRHGRELQNVQQSDLGVDGSIDLEFRVVNTFDARGRIVSSIQDSRALGTLVAHYVTGFEYDARGRLVHETSDYDHDGDGTIDQRLAHSIAYSDGTDPVLLSGGSPVADTAPELHWAAPTPFAERTSLRYVLPVRADADLRVYDAAGRHVRTLAEGLHDAGEHVATWDGTDAAGRRVPSGTYFARLHVANQVTTKRLVFVR